jgi:hypothetical protein
MLAQLRRHYPSPAMVVALAALFVALGGSSYAALVLKANSVSSKHIKNGQVKGVDLGKASIDSSKVVNGKLLAEDFAAGQLPAGARGPQGPQGPQGATGAPGAAGTDGADGSALIAQARCDGCPVESGDPFDPQDIPLTESDWTQLPDEANELWVEMTWSPPPTCTAAPGPLPAGGRVQVLLDGNPDPIAISEDLAGSGVRTVTFPATHLFSEAAGEHFVTALVGDNCTGSENAMVDEVKVDVAGMQG